MSCNSCSQPSTDALNFGVLWLDIAERRAQEIDEGRVQLVTPQEFERRVEARLK